MPENLITLDMAKELIDFSGGKPELDELGKLQSEGAVALYNRIQRTGVAYLADEVGMGKTYMGLGVVTLMRYCQPSLRVLFILPKQNILNKWCDTDYRNFLRENFRVADYRVKNEHHEPIAKPAVCSNLKELIEMSSTGYYGDFFIKMSSFSFGLSDDKLEERLDDLQKLVPAYRKPDVSDLDKKRVKEEYAKIINEILPWFDLVVVDEAHNFRKGPEVSDRNQVLSRILGTWPKGEGKRKAGKVLLLSATPFEFGLDELKKQFEIFGYGSLIQDTGLSKDARNRLLNQFMVRRINELQIGEQRLTRNMYRCEHRGDAAITLDDKDYKTKLVTALVQKKVGELIREMRGQYQTGMLASFESYLPSSTRLDVEFDGDQENRGEAKDASLIRRLATTYREKTGQQTLPHPKMDKVVEQYGKDAFYKGEKQLIFVRRIKSVDDLKAKFDAQYDNWLRSYLEKQIKNQEAKRKILAIYDDFTRRKDEMDAGVTIEDWGDDIDRLEAVPANNNFFTYFFRGKFEDATDGFIKPLSFRKLLTQKRNDELVKVAKAFDENGEFYSRMETLLGEEPEEKAFYRELMFSLLRIGHGFIDLYIAYLNGGSESFLDVFMQMLQEQKEHQEKFSTYQQIKDLHDNFTLIVKTNFSGYRDEKDLRRYIQYRLSPLEPVSGAKGGDDKSAISRKFRTPGYPMVLISTDVLQEGEDLHTFCDSIAHYGLSASPIAIEQKTGRVDRVGALAHRRLKASNDLEKVSENGIQIFFPFLKESIEAVQVREIARRLNEFLQSMHDFDRHTPSVDENTEKALADRSEIPPLIKFPLESPFKVTSNDLNPEGKLVKLDIGSYRRRVKQIKAHVLRLLEPYAEQIEYQLTTGTSPHTMVLKIADKDKRYRYRLTEMADPHLHSNFMTRTTIDTWKGDEIILNQDVHLYVGDKKITQQEEITDTISRLNIGADEDVVKEKKKDWSDLFDLEFLHKADFLRNHTINASVKKNAISFQFGIGENVYRKQNVEIASIDGYVLLTSKVVNLNEIRLIKETKEEFVVKHTFLRNTVVDFVDFYLEENWIKGRILHPLANLQMEEFMFYTYILACETDRLEHLVNDFDKGDRY